MPKCKEHNVDLICPKCRAAEGGKARARKYTKEQLKRMGEAGGRPKTKALKPKSQG